ncbi:MAG: YceD family protein [bacterium]|nr:YceD family protein [bacterium]
MSATTLPQYIDAQKWADREAVIDQAFPLAAFARVCEGAASSEGEVRVSIRVHRDAQGLIVLEGKLSTGVALICQRCLEPVVTDVNADVQLWLLWNEEAADQLPDEADFVLQDAEGRIDLVDVLEDELLLALPLVAAHEDCQPYQVADVNEVEVEVAVVETPKRENPFQVLTGLKAGHDKK